MASVSTTDKQVHGRPTMRFTGTMTADRSGSTINVSVSGTHKFVSAWYGRGYGFYYSVEYSGNLKDHICIKDPGTSVGSNENYVTTTRSVSMNFSFDDNAAGTLVCYGLCCYGGTSQSTN